jgi:hypothetical protein
MKIYEGVGVDIHAYLIFSLDRGGRSASITEKQPPVPIQEGYTGGMISMPRLKTVESK